MINKQASLAVLTTLALAGCMSQEEAADQAFQQALQETGLDGQNIRQQAGILDGAQNLFNGAKEWLGEQMLCQVLRRAMGNDPGAQSIMLMSGGFWEGSLGPVVGEYGSEKVYDLANYQIGHFKTFQAGAAFGFRAITARRGGYKGLLWGQHSSVLDTAGVRTSQSVSWGPPLLKMLFGEIGLRTIQKPNLNKFLAGAAVEGEIGIKIGSGDVEKVGFDVEVKGGSVWADNGSVAEAAERHADLGAKLNTRCGDSGHFVQFDGLAEHANDGYHTRRAKAMAEAIKRDHGFLGVIAAKALLGLGVARDHGGFGAVCGGGDDGGLDESPVPEPRCPDRADLNPEEPQASETATDPHNPDAVGGGTDTAPTGCHLYQKFDLRYCSTDCPCAEGEGDCDLDDECQPGLKCLKDAGAQYNGPANVDVCGRDGAATVDPGTDPEATDPGIDPGTDPGTGEGGLQATFLAPQDGATVGNEVQVEIAVDGTDIERVVLLVDNNFEKEWTAAPFTATVVLEAGTHILTAVVKDRAGNLNQSAAISVTVGSAGATQPGGGYGNAEQNPGTTTQQPWSTGGSFPGEESGGCSLAGSASQPDAALAAALLLLVAFGARRRRR